MTHLELVGYLRAIDDFKQFVEKSFKEQYDVSYTQLINELEKMEREAKS